jgi:hypothetical protein
MLVRQPMPVADGKRDQPRGQAQAQTAARPEPDPDVTVDQAGDLGRVREQIARLVIIVGANLVVVGQTLECAGNKPSKPLKV